MLLITFNEWFGPTRGNEDKVPTSDCVTSVVTLMRLPEALLHMHAYQEAHNSKYRATAVNFKLVAVETIDYLNSTVRDKMSIPLIEDLPTTADEIP